MPISETQIRQLPSNLLNLVSRLQDIIPVIHLQFIESCSITTNSSTKGW